jgi:hypothetical protein
VRIIAFVGGLLVLTGATWLEITNRGLLILWIVGVVLALPAGWSMIPDGEKLEKGDGPA